MRYPYAWCLVTYSSASGDTTLTVWNGRDGVLDEQIDLPNGLPGTITASEYMGEGYMPDPSVTVVTGTPPDPMPPAGSSEVALGYPGQPYLQQ